MRLKIYLQGKKNLKIPYNYNHILSAIIYNKIADLDFAYELHSSNTFKFFTFSQINFNKKPIIKNELTATDGKINFLVSTPNEYLIKSLIDGFLEDLEIKFKNETLKIEKIEALKNPDFKHKSEFKTISPIIIRSKKIINGKEKIWDLAPCDDFFKAIENNLIKKYLIFHDLKETDKQVTAYSEMANVKRKRISIDKCGKTTFHRAYMMDILLEGDIDLIKFAYDVGLGEKNSMGFGMLKYMEKD